MTLLALPSAFYSLRHHWQNHISWWVLGTQNKPSHTRRDNKITSLCFFFFLNNWYFKINVLLDLYFNYVYLTTHDNIVLEFLDLSIEFLVGIYLYSQSICTKSTDRLTNRNNPSEKLSLVISSLSVSPLIIFLNSGSDICSNFFSTL